MTPLSALILTAGRSSRMGSPKAWLRLAGQTLLERVVTTAQAGGAANVVIVVGSEDDPDPNLVSRQQIRQRLAAHLGPQLEIVIGCPQAHPIDSIRKGLARVPDGHHVLLWPVDHPFADATLVRQLARAATLDSIVVPMAKGRRGHPILVGARVAPELAAPISDAGAHHVVRRDPSRIIAVSASDERVARDLDTSEDARVLGISIKA